MVLGGNVRGGVSPVLEQMPRRRGLRNRRAIVTAKAREEWKFLTPYENVDRVDLHHTHGAHCSSNVALGHPCSRSWSTETLSGKSYSTRLVEREATTGLSRRR